MHFCSQASLFHGFSTLKIKAVKVSTVVATYPTVQEERHVGQIAICKRGNNEGVDFIMILLFMYFSLSNQHRLSPFAAERPVKG